MSFVLMAKDSRRPVILENAIAFLRKLPDSKSWRVDISEHKKRRTSQQNRYLFGVAYAELARVTGQPSEDWHEYFLGEHYGWETVEMLGRRKLRPVRRSSRLTKAEFAEHVEFIQARAAEHGIYIPDPNEG